MTTQWEGYDSWTRKPALLWKKSAGTLILVSQFPDLWKVFLLFRSTPVQDFLLQQPEWTKTRTSHSNTFYSSKKKKRKRFYLSSEASVFWNFDSYSLQAVLPIFLGVNMNTSSSKAYPCLYDLYKAMLSEWDYFCQSLVHFLHNSQILFQLLSCFSFSKTVDEFHMALSLSFPENLYIPDIFI